MILLVLAIAIALGISFICSLMEATLLSIRPSQIADIVQHKPALGRIWESFKTDIERPIGVILIINTAAHTIGATVAGAEFDRIYGDKWIWLFSLIFTVVMVQFTEILPKTLGVRFNHALAVFSARPLYAAVGIMSPLLKVIHWINRPFQIKPHKLGEGEQTTIEEISALAGLARLSRQISHRQERIINGASRLSGLTAGQVMIPIEHVSFLSTAQTISEALISAHIDAHTRFPVCENGDKNHVVGFVNFKEMIYFMRTNPNDSSLRGVIRPVLFVEPKTPIPALLEMFVEQHVHMSIVKNEDGRTSGMVTMEDIVEELLGDIQDEFDHLPKTMHTLSEGTWMIGGGTAMQDVVRQTGLDIQSSRETLAIWLGARLNKIPVPGDVYKEAGAEFTVRRIRRGKAYDVSVTREKRVANAGAKAGL